MKLGAKIAERYVVAVNRESERNRLYAELIDAQTSGIVGLRGTMFATVESRIEAAQRAVDEHETVDG